MNPSRLFKVLIVVLTLASGRVVAEPLPQGHVRLSTGEGELIAPGGKHFTLPVGAHVLDNTTWEKLDAEVRGLQDSKTRLEAENKSLKTSLQTAPQMGWGSAFLLVAFMTVTGGIAYAISEH